MPALVIPVTEHDHARGAANAPLTLVQYGDFECPHCALAYPRLTEIANELGDSLRLVFRHFPLNDVHPRAQRAAEAAEAAAKQGRFWEIVPLLHENYEKLDDETLIRCAKKAGVDAKRLMKEVESGTHAARVRADYLGGLRSGVNGTPAFFINGERYEGALGLDALVVALLKASRTKVR